MDSLRVEHEFKGEELSQDCTDRTTGHSHAYHSLSASPGPLPTPPSASLRASRNHQGGSQALSLPRISPTVGFNLAGVDVFMSTLSAVDTAGL